MEVRPYGRLHTLAPGTVRIPKLRISRTDSRLRPADPIERDGRVRSLGMAAMVASRSVAGGAQGKGRIESRLGETDSESRSVCCGYILGSPVRHTTMCA